MQLDLLKPTSRKTPFSKVFDSTEIINKLYISRIEMTTNKIIIMPKSNPKSILAADDNYIVCNKLISDLG